MIQLLVLIFNVCMIQQQHWSFVTRQLRLCLLALKAQIITCISTMPPPPCLDEMFSPLMIFHAVTKCGARLLISRIRTSENVCQSPGFESESISSSIVLVQSPSAPAGSFPLRQYARGPQHADVSATTWLDRHVTAVDGLNGRRVKHVSYKPTSLALQLLDHSCLLFFDKNWRVLTPSVFHTLGQVVLNVL